MNRGGSYVGRSRFVWEDLGDLVTVEDQYSDLSPSMSVTNDAEGVIGFLAGQKVLSPGKTVVYRDTDGMWDELRHNSSGFAGFFPIRAGSKIEAIRAVRERAPRSYPKITEEK